MSRLLVYSLLAALCLIGLGWLFVSFERARLCEAVGPGGDGACHVRLLLAPAQIPSPSTHADADADAAHEWYRMVA